MSRLNVAHHGAVNGTARIAFPSPRPQSPSPAMVSPPPKAIAGAIVGAPAYITLPDSSVVGFGVVRYTPEVVAAVTGNNFRARRQHRVTHYAQQMARSLWRVTPQSIVFFQNGERADGDHRLSAVASSGKAVDIITSWGWPTDITAVIDTGLPRVGVDYVRSTINPAWSNTDLAAVRALVNGTTASSGNAGIFDNDTLADLSLVLHDAVEFARVSLVSAKFRARGGIRAVVAAGYYRFDRDLLAKFCRGLITGLDMSTGSEQWALLARNKVIESSGISNSEQQRQLAGKVFRAMKGFVTHEPVPARSANFYAVDEREALRLPADVRRELDSLLPRATASNE